MPRTHGGNKPEILDPLEVALSELAQTKEACLLLVSPISKLKMNGL